MMQQGLLVAEETTTVPASDAEIVSASLEEGGSEAFCELVKRYKGMVMGRVFSIVRDHHEAEDLAQETFVRAYKSLAQLKESARFAGWVASIAKNLALRWASKGKTVPLEGLSEATRRGQPVAREASTDPLDAASRRELYERVLDEVEGLPEAYRSAVYLRYLKGCSCREIAEIEGTQVGVVTSRLTRAGAMLRRKLAPILGKGDAS